MKVSREQAAENRSRIVEVASQLFRERGLDGIGVADLMKAAGLTHGGFYGHFDSKDDLAVEAFGRALEGTADVWTARAGDATAPLAAVVDGYLSGRHRDNPGKGCAFAALAADVARQGHPALRRRLTAGLQPLIESLSRLVPGRSKRARRKQALASLSGMVGALILARAVNDSTLSDEILAAARSVFAGDTAKDVRAPAAG